MVRALEYACETKPSQIGVRRPLIAAQFAVWRMFARSRARLGPLGLYGTALYPREGASHTRGA